MCLSSRKDFRNAVVAARKAQKSWQSASALNKGPDSISSGRNVRRSEIAVHRGVNDDGLVKSKAKDEVEQSIDRLVIMLAGATNSNRYLVQLTLWLLIILIFPYWSLWELFP